MTPLTRAPVGLQPTRSERCPAHTTSPSATLPARPAPHGVPVGTCATTDRVSRVANHPHLTRVPPPLPRRDRPVRTSLASRSITAFPVPLPGRLPQLPFSGPARRSLALRPACLLSRPRRPVTSKCFRPCRYLHNPLRLLPAGATVAGRVSHPLEGSAFHGAQRKGAGEGGPGPSMFAGHRH